MFAKHAVMNADLYEDYVAPGIGEWVLSVYVCVYVTLTTTHTAIDSGLLVECWCDIVNHYKCMDSYCKGGKIVDPSNPQKSEKFYKFDSVQIDELKFSSSLWFTIKYDHAKWAVGYNGKDNCSPWFCEGDNNRDHPQRYVWLIAWR